MLVAALTITSINMLPTGAEAAKKPKLSKSKASVNVGKSITLKVKNGKKKAKVTWKTSKKAVAKLGKKVTAGNKASVVVKGVKAGKATITASYKLGKKTTKLNCKLTVNSITEPTMAPITAPTVAPTATTVAAKPTVPATIATATAAVTAVPATAVPTTKATKKPTNPPKTATPVPTSTPVPSADAYVNKAYTPITIDGTVDATWDEIEALNISNWTPDAEGNTSQTTNAKAKLMWDDKNLYVLVTADDPQIDLGNSADYYKDSVELFVDEHNYKSEWGQNNEFQYRVVCDPTLEEFGKLTDKQYWDGDPIKSAVTTSDTGYVVEIAVPFKDAHAAKDFVGIELQINDASKLAEADGDNTGARNGTWNLFADPANGDAIPYDSLAVFGNCQLKTMTKIAEKPFDLSKAAIPTASTESKYDEANKTIVCKNVNNITVPLPEGVTVVEGQTVNVRLKATYNGTAGFRVWLVGGYAGNDAATTLSNQEKFTPSTGEFDQVISLTATGDCDGIMVKAPSFDTSIEDLIIKAISIETEVEFNPADATPEPSTAPTADPNATAAPTADPSATDAPTTDPNATAAPEVDYSTYKVDFSDSELVDLTQYTGGSSCVLNGDKSITLTTASDCYGQGHDVVIDIPSEIAAYKYSKVTINYELTSGTFNFKYYAGSTYDEAHQKWGYGNAKYALASGKTETSLTFDDADYPITRMTIFDVNSQGTIKINSITFSEPKAAPSGTAE